MLKGNRRASYIGGPSGYALTLANLPTVKGTRWVARRKAELVIAVGSGIIALAEACERYAISTDEFFEWERAFALKGVAGLRALSLPKGPTSGAPPRTPLKTNDVLFERFG